MLRSFFFGLITVMLAMSAPLFMLVAAPTETQAQEGARPTSSAGRPFGGRNEMEAGEAYHPPAVFVQDVQLAERADNSATISGLFTLYNSTDETVGNLHYRLDLLGALLRPEDSGTTVISDTAPVYDSMLAGEIFTLIPGEKRLVLFNYEAPDLPAGEYRLRIQATAARDRDLGWADATVLIGSPDIIYVDLTPGTIESPEYPDEIIPPESGPNVAPGSSITLRASASAKSRTIVVSVVEILELGGTGAVIETVTGSPVTVGRDTPLQVPVTVSNKAGVYYAKLSLRNPDDTNRRQSALAEYRWVVRGASAQIISARVTKFAQKAGQQMIVDVEVVGPGDAETTLTGTLEMELYDKRGQVSRFTVPEELVLSDAVTGGSARLTLERDLGVEPGLRVVLTDANGAELASYNMPLQLTDEQRQSLAESQKTLDETMPFSGKGNNWWLAGLGAAAVIAIGIVIMWARRRPKRPSPISMGVLMLGAALAAGAGLAQAAGGGNGIQVVAPIASQDYHSDWRPLGSKPVIEVFINEPQHNAPAGTYSREAVPYSVRVEWAVCKNQVAGARIAAHYLNQAIASSELRPPEGALFKSAGNQPAWGYDCKKDEAQCLRCTGDRCLQGQNFVAPAGLNLSELIEGAAKTTLQVVGVWDWTRVPDKWEPNGGSLNDHYISLGHVHATNLWLNFGAGPSPTPTACPADVVFNGDFARESAREKYAKTFIASVTCQDSASGQRATFGEGGSADAVVGAVNSAIKAKNLPLTPISNSRLVRSDGGTGGGFKWIDNGKPHLPTLQATCAILGYDTYVNSTCLDNERSGNYPNGKCNYHTPENNQLTRFNGTVSFNKGQSCVPASPSPSPSPSPTPTPPPTTGGQAALCEPPQQMVAAGEEVRFRYTGSSTTWQAPGGNPSTGDGPTFSTQYSRGGAYKVSVASYPPYYDVNGDGSVTQDDATEVLAAINFRGPNPSEPGQGAAWQNQANRFDVTGGGGAPDGVVSYKDAIVIVEYINSGKGPLPSLECQVGVDQPAITPPVPTPTPTGGPFDPGRIRETD